MNSHPTKLGRIDRLGTSLSFACAIHCVIVRFCCDILPLLGIGFLADERVERTFLAVSLTLATASVCWGVRIQEQRRILFAFGAALFLILSGHGLFEGVSETVSVASGALLFVCGHLLNRRLCRRCSGACSYQSQRT